MVQVNNSRYIYINFFVQLNGKYSFIPSFIFLLIHSFLPFIPSSLHQFLYYPIIHHLIFLPLLSFLSYHSFIHRYSLYYEITVIPYFINHYFLHNQSYLLIHYYIFVTSLGKYLFHTSFHSSFIHLSFLYSLHY